MSNRSAELSVAVEAVRTAARSCQVVADRLVSPETLEKKDKSPVTVADLASQAIVCSILAERFPDVPVVGEEDSAALRDGEQDVLRRAVVERVAAELAVDEDESRVLDWIDLGNDDASGRRYWTLDPIDGTKGFLRGDQYAVALGLIEDGEVVLGVLGCPKLSTEGGVGALFTSARGGPAQVLSLEGESTEGRVVRVSDVARAADARFCESVESAHSNQSESARIAARLGITSEPFRIDSQCKYAAVAQGDASIYLRLPTHKDYQEKIWDHAAGMLVVECAGGRVTDAEGAPLDFRAGPTLANNQGVVATSGAVHDEVIEAIRSVRAGADG